MSPPSYTDIGKSARDLINKHFGLGVRFFHYQGNVGPLEFTSHFDSILRLEVVWYIFN